MKSKLVVCCDGTSNSEYLGEEKSPLTNVSRISRAIRQFGPGCRQTVLYLPGIGTDESNPLNLINQGLGVGMNSQIKEAYTFLCHNYCNETNDDIILLGFSRGAFAARCIMDLISRKGLLCKGDLVSHGFSALGCSSFICSLLGYIGYTGPTEEWMGTPADTTPVIKTAAETHTALSTIQVPGVKLNVWKPKIRVCALWDTVNSVGLPKPWRFRRAKPKLGFVGSALGDEVENAIQALSLFEHRFHFHPFVMRTLTGSKCKLKQCWFPGYHGDIGGGNEKEVLAHFALAWMISRLRDFLEFDESAFWYRKNNEPTWVLPNEIEILNPHNSWWGWKFAGSSHRMPCLDFWDHEGVYHESPAHIGINSSMERMHPSVRFMSNNGLLTKHFRTCQSLDSARLQKTQGVGFCWTLFLSDAVVQLWGKAGDHSGTANPAHNHYRVLEGELDPREEAMLFSWAEDEHNRLLEELSEPGEGSPPTIVLGFKVWLMSKD